MNTGTVPLFTFYLRYKGGINLTVQFYSYVIDKAKGSTSYLPKNSANVSQLIDEMGEQLGQDFKDFLLGDETCLFLVNGSGILLTGGLNTKLKQGDKIEILPFVGAG